MDPAILESLGPEGRALYEGDSDSVRIEVRRERIQEGRSFSEEAMHEAHVSIALFITARLLKRWETTKEPPSVMGIDIDLHFG